MAQNTLIDIPPKTWTLLTNSDVAEIVFQNAGNDYILVAATTTADSPSGNFARFRVNPGAGERMTLAELFPGIAGTRLHAWSDNGGTVAVSHA